MLFAPKLARNPMKQLLVDTASLKVCGLHVSLREGLESHASATSAQDRL